MLWLINVSPRFVVCWVLLCDVLLLFSLPGRPSWHQSPHGWEVLLMRTSSSLSIRRSKHFTRFTFIDLANTFLLFIYMYYLISHVCINQWPRYEKLFRFLSFFLSFSLLLCYWLGSWMTNLHHSANFKLSSSGQLWRWLSSRFPWNLQS